MKTIRCYFVDFWPGFLPKEHLPILNNNFNIVIDKNKPDYLFFSCFGREHYKYPDCIKIFVCGENAEPNFNDCDYAISYSKVQYGDRAIHHSLANSFQHNPLPMFSREELLNRKFCNFIYSNSLYADPYRVRFFKELSKYKKVDSGGPLLNNMGACVPKSRGSKIEFQSQYKFSIAIENSIMIGYTTEKLPDPLWAHSLPIYRGNPLVTQEYHPKSLINLLDYPSMEEAIEEIIRLDHDDEAYLEKVTAPFWLEENSFEEYRNKKEEKILHFYNHIFDQPFEQAFRRTRYGWVKISNEEQLALSTPSTLYAKKAWRKLKSILRH